MLPKASQTSQIDIPSLRGPPSLPTPCSHFFPSGSPTDARPDANAAGMEQDTQQKPGPL